MNESINIMLKTEITDNFVLLQLLSIPLRLTYWTQDGKKIKNQINSTLNKLCTFNWTQSFYCCSYYSFELLDIESNPNSGNEMLNFVDPHKQGLNWREKVCIPGNFFIW